VRVLRGCRFGAAPSVVGGGLRLPLRLSGAGQPGEGCANDTASNLQCELADGSPASYSTNRIVCTLPAGVGGGFQVRSRRVAVKLCEERSWSTCP
jgi:hypothetical protein